MHAAGLRPRAALGRVPKVGLDDRGRVLEGMAADLIAFDPDRIAAAEQLPGTKSPEDTRAASSLPFR